jgi:hypothetical protein
MTYIDSEFFSCHYNCTYIFIIKKILSQYTVYPYTYSAIGKNVKNIIDLVGYH